MLGVVSLKGCCSCLLDRICGNASSKVNAHHWCFASVSLVSETFRHWATLVTVAKGNGSWRGVEFLKGSGEDTVQGAVLRSDVEFSKG